MTAQQAATSGTQPPAWTRRPASLASAVTSELVQRIVRGEHSPGTLLPTEHALCATFSVSRPVVREAIKMLQEKGLVQVRRGAGTMITCAEAVEQLWAYLDESLPARDRAALEEHLGFCRVCCGEVEFAKELRVFLARSAAEELPEDVRARLTATLDDLETA
jgi:mycothiol system anti-sigma-R factor